MISSERLFKRIDDMEPEYVKILEEFCLIESPTDYKESVDAASNYIIKKAEAFGWKVERQKQEVAGDCICITMNPDATAAPVCLSGHVDTVHPLGLFQEPVVKYDGDKMYGPGIADCKGGIVASFLAMAALSKENFTARPIKLILQSDEETSSIESNHTTVDYMCECARGSVAFLNCEPTLAGTAVLKRKGIIRYAFHVTGKAEHASVCYHGVSAISEAAHKILELEQYKDAQGITANCGKISGGTKANSVPAQCTFEVDFRFSNSEERTMVENIAKKVAETSYIEGTTCELVLESFRDAMELTDANLKLLEKANEIFEEVGLSVLSVRESGGGSDASYTTMCGIPTLDSVGVASMNIHSKDEYTLISSFTEAAKRLAAICCYI
ncbi:MAG: M20/M25/M40 family metallo-hydrolase [Clostridia bacterium]|nr:M20/M25/M40 family metallo-hydrolase [Clostridia bacterium]